jgi:two-component system chemotaxis response regulator CheB
MNGAEIKVLIAEDSAAAQVMLVQLLNSDPQIRIVGVAKTGQEVLRFLSRQLPDVIVMGLQIREMDGFETTRRIMETRPLPIIICSGEREGDTITAFRAMEAGAVACVTKPTNRSQENFDTIAAHLLQTVKLMSEVKVVRRWPRRDQAAGTRTVSPREPQSGIEIVGIGASTGGPPVLQAILSELPRDFPAPIVVVQHIAAGFLAGLVEWLNQTSGLKVHIAAYGVQPLPGHVYFAPDDLHLELSEDNRLTLKKEPPESGLRPSIDHLFHSIAAVGGRRAAAVLLTGMGKDGAAGLKHLKDRGAITIAQDRDSSVVHGMPGEAIAIGAATHVLPAERIAGALNAIASNQHIEKGVSS